MSARTTLGRTGLEVSALALGAVSLGVDYGIAAPGDFGCPCPADAERLVRHAVEHGIDLIDTAPAYGRSEEVVGRALAGRDDVVVATKISVGADPRASVESSLRALRREALDVVQIHNATCEVVAAGELAGELEQLRDEGKIRFLGASVYTSSEALAVVEAGCFDVLQVAYNLLDRRMEPALAVARAAGVGVVLRSALLKGVLTEKSRHLPTELAGLGDAADRVRLALAASWGELPAAALRFCLGRPATSVLVGVRTAAELDIALAACAAGPLPERLRHSVDRLAPVAPQLLDPSRWAAVA